MMRQLRQFVISWIQRFLLLFRSTLLFGLGVSLIGFFTICEPAQATQVCFMPQVNYQSVQVQSGSSLSYWQSFLSAQSILADLALKIKDSNPVLAPSSTQNLNSPSWDSIRFCIDNGGDSKNISKLIYSGTKLLVFHGFMLLMTFLFSMRV